jgi:RNA polymerase sigma factor (sigma-70 family)
VFVDLARKAGGLNGASNLSGWLYTSARFAALKLVRSEQRRSAREQEAHAMSELAQNAAPEPDWSRLEPVLDDAMHELKDADREALLLRYFENRALADVGARLGISENAARMRVDRAVEKLRGLLARRGISSAAGLAAALSTNAVQAAPVGLAASVAGVSIAAATASGGGMFITKLIVMTKIKLALGTLAAIGGAAVIVMQHQSLAQQRQANQALQDRVAQLEADAAQNPAPAPRPAQTQREAPSSELLRLRGEVGALRQQQSNAQQQQQRQAQQAKIELDQTQAQKQFDSNRVLMINSLRQILVGAMINAQDHSGAFPTNFESMTKELGGVAGLDASRLDEFEFVNPGTVASASSSTTCLFREKTPKHGPDGQWYRAYGFADGHAQILKSPDGNFDAVEKSWQIQSSAQ